MTGDPALDQLYGPLPPPPRVVRVRLIPWLLGLVLVGALCIGAYYWAKAAGWLTPIDRFTKRGDEMNGIGIKNKFTYPAEPAALTPAVNGGDPHEEFRREVLRRFGLLEARVGALENEMKQRRTTAPVKTTPVPTPKKHRSMMFVSNTLEKDDAPDPDTYQLAPGATKLPCVVETAINSDVGDSYWTAKVRNDVYDTATGRQLLVPQGSTILGKASGSALLYGNERIPTFSLTLSLRDGRSVDLGQAPATDQQGMAGLTGKVDQHYWRLFSAIFIGGVLRGGTQAIMIEAAGAGAAGQVAAGIAGNANQVSQQRLGRALDTRPTIEVESGSLCQVILTKPLHLPAVARR
jgi:type IV secretory pathway VirB10-like protein